MSTPAAALSKRLALLASVSLLVLGISAIPATIDSDMEGLSVKVSWADDDDGDRRGARSLGDDRDEPGKRANRERRNKRGGNRSGDREIIDYSDEASLINRG